MRSFLLFLFFLLVWGCSSLNEKYSLTPKDEQLAMAIKDSDLVRIKQLIKNGANVNARLETDVSFLMLSAGGAYSKITRDEKGMSRVSMQKIKDNYKVTELLIKNNADVNFINRTGRTALIQAAIMGNLKIVKLLVDSGADVSIRDKSKTRAIDYASRLGHRDVVEYLLGVISR